MKHFLIATAFLLTSSFLFGQAPYAGGQGDGYAKATLTLSKSFDEPASAWIVQEENVLHLRGIEGIAHWQVFDAVGREVTSRKSLLSSGEARISLPKESIAAGAYLVKVDIDGRVFVCKWRRPHE